MNSFRTDRTESRGGMVSRNEWETILERLDTLTDEITRALGWSINIEEPTGCIRIARPQKVIDHGKSSMRCFDKKSTP